MVCNREHLLSAVGCGSADRTGSKNNHNPRKIVMHISIDELIKHKDVVLSVAEHLSQLFIKNETDDDDNENDG